MVRMKQGNVYEFIWGSLNASVVGDSYRYLRTISLEELRYRLRVEEFVFDSPAG